MTIRTIQTTFLALAALLLALPAHASDALDGTWQLDPKASDDIGPMMDLMGVPRAMQAVARKMKTKLTIDGSPDKVVMTYKTPIRTDTSETPTDGTVITLEGGEFGAGTISATWSEDGSALIAVSDTALEDGRKVHNVTTRKLEGPDTLLQQFDVEIEGEETITLRRIFRRMSD